MQVISDCKPFSSFKADEAFFVLGTARGFADDAAAAFPLAPYDPMASLDSVLEECLHVRTHGDIIQHVGKELALRCCKTDPDRYNKEASKRELISPVIFAAAALAGVLIRCLFCIDLEPHVVISQHECWPSLLVVLAASFENKLLMCGEPHGVCVG